MKTVQQKVMLQLVKDINLQLESVTSDFQTELAELLTQEERLELYDGANMLEKVQKLLEAIKD